MKQLKLNKKGEPLYGLILAGGKSSRMKTDKALLEIHGQKQSDYCGGLLKKFCAKVFISNREDQSGRDEKTGYIQIHDTAPFVDIGPIGGILSAMSAHPDASWLVLAVDLPFVNEEVLRHLLGNRDLKKMATAYISSSDGLPEPLCAVYERASFAAMKDFLKAAKICPRKFLLTMGKDVKLLKQPVPDALCNLNTPEELYRLYPNLKI